MRPSDDAWDQWRRRMGSDFPSFFAEFEKEFARMQGMIDRIMNDAIKHAEGPRRGDPFVYGFTMRVGKDGVPQFQPFGSSAKDMPTGIVGRPDAPDEEVRQPLVDVVESDREVAVTVEMPGVEKGDVRLHVADDVVTVSSEKGRKYQTRIGLPTKVVPSTAKATFKNGILDVTIRRKEERHDQGTEVKID